MCNSPICKQNSLNGFDYSISLAESIKYSLSIFRNQFQYT